MAAIDEQLTRFLTRYPNLNLAILFGSQATGQAAPGSDIDLGLLFDKPLSGSDKLGIIEAIGAEFGRPVDIVDLFYVPEPVTGQVFKGKRLLGDDTVYAELLTKHLVNTADFLPLRERILAERRTAWTG
jgi:predicted nucleotidyltransferase